MDKKDVSRRGLLLITAALISNAAFARGGGRGGRGGWGRRGSGGTGALGFLAFIAGGLGCWWVVAKLFGRKSLPEATKPSIATHLVAKAPPPYQRPMDKTPRQEWDRLGLCPQCGSTMRRKIAKSSRYSGKAFMGCATYPRCKGIRPSRLPG